LKERKGEEGKGVDFLPPNSHFWLRVRPIAARLLMSHFRSPRCKQARLPGGSTDCKENAKP